MKRAPREGRSKPSYKYDLHEGLTRRRVLPTATYMLLTIFAMGIAFKAANIQVKNNPKNPASIVQPISSSQVLPAPESITITPQVAEVPYEDSKLEAVITNFAAAHPANQWSVEVYGLGNDERSASYNASTKYSSASIFKLLLTYPLSQKTPIDKWASTSLNVGNSTQSLADCVTAMLRVSDNACGEAVGDYVGWGYADKQLRIIGLSNTTLNNPNGPVTTAADTAYYLRGLSAGKWFDPATKNFVLNILSIQTLRSGIPAGCKGCNVADKTGDTTEVRHDAGIITYNGGSYVLSIFTNGASASQIAELTNKIQADISSSN